jgi:phospholipid-binding lipoprotein MlaA
MKKVNYLNISSCFILFCAIFTSNTLYASSTDNDQEIKITDKAVDPFEPMNRKLFKFNEKADRYILKPVATAYKNYTPEPIQSALSNVYGNISDVYSLFNNILQLKPQNVAEDTLRVAINTVFGLGGTIDIASKAGIMKHREDFGQTLGRWGVGNGPYLILPMLGPSTVRDAVGTSVHMIYGPTDVMSKSSQKIAYTSGDIIVKRANLLDLTNGIDNVSLDKYTFIRNAYLQKRRYDIADGNLLDDEDDLKETDETTETSTLIQVPNITSTTEILEKINSKINK